MTFAIAFRWTSLTGGEGGLGGIERGIEKGMALGVARGRHEGERAMVTRAAELRGGSELAALVALVPDDALTQAFTVLVETQDSGAARTALLALTPAD